MNAMVLRRVQYQFERPDIADHRRVYPQLIYQVELIVNHKVRRWYEGGEQQVKHL